MNVFEITTPSGLFIHISFEETNRSCCILVYDIYNHLNLKLKFFDNAESAKKFIDSL